MHETEQNYFMCNFVRGNYGEHLCEISLIMYRPMIWAMPFEDFQFFGDVIPRFFLFLALVATLFRGMEQFGQFL